MVETAKSTFKIPNIEENPTGWGPCTVPAKYKDIPYQPFSKADRLGKAADFTGTAYQGRRDRYQSQYGAGGDMFSYFEEDADSSFQLVDTTKMQKNNFQHRRRWQNRRYDRRDRRDGQNTVKSMKERDRQRMERKLQKKWAGRRRWVERPPIIKMREPSVDVKADWKVEEEIDFSQLSKLHKEVKAPTDLLVCGTLEQYDTVYNRVTTKSERPLMPTERTSHKVTTTDDPHIREFSQSAEGKHVFATDAILAAIMACPRSVYSWDLVISRVGDDTMFIDKRDQSDFDYLTVSETSIAPPQEEGDHVNSPSNLHYEATYINQAFSQQCLKRDNPYTFDNPNPFMQDDEEVSSVAYRYRKWDLGDGIKVVARCEHDAYVRDRKGKDQFVNIKTLNEWDPKATKSMDWRQKLDTQRGAVLATALKDNSYKLAKWTVGALLAGSHHLRIGYVSRATPTDPQSHVVLGTQSFKPKEFATQINLNMANCWGILRAFVDLCMKQPEGKYVIMKDPMKSIIHIYAVPENTFEDDDEESDDEDEIGISTKNEESFLGDESFLMQADLTTV